MPGIFKGSTPLNPSLGSVALKEVYVGSTKVWPSGPPPPPVIDMTNLDGYWLTSTPKKTTTEYHNE